MTVLPQIQHELVACLAILCLTYLGDNRQFDVSNAIAGVALGVAGAKVMEKRSG